MKDKVNCNRESKEFGKVKKLRFIGKRTKHNDCCEESRVQPIGTNCTLITETFKGEKSHLYIVPCHSNNKLKEVIGKIAMGLISMVAVLALPVGK